MLEMESQRLNPDGPPGTGLQTNGPRHPRVEFAGKVLGLVAAAIGITVGIFAIYEHLKSPSLALELMIPYTGWEVSVKNTGSSTAKQVHVGVVIWRNSGVPAADIRESYRIEDLPPGAQSSIPVEVISNSHDFEYLEKNARESRSGYIVVSCDGCRRPRARAFYIPGTNDYEKEKNFFPYRGGLWPTIDFRYPDRTPFLNDCVNYPQGVCGPGQQWNAEAKSLPHSGIVVTPPDPTILRK
jgi:hypothetical protein